ncbi:MAG: hypothetical protein Q4E17_01085 [Synergistes sp.]|nr:hypothetical protein [Synergistes sp.]
MKVKMDEIKIIAKMTELKEQFRSLSPQKKRAKLLAVAAAICLAFALLYTVNGLVTVYRADKFDVSPDRSGTSGKEAQENAKSLSSKAAAFNKMRSEAQRLAAEADNVGRSPLGVLGEGQHTDDENEEEYDDENSSAVYVPVPAVTIKGIITSGGSSACILDIDGEESGRTYKVGASFGRGRGKIISVETDSVVWRWGDTEYRSDLQ